MRARNLTSGGLRARHAAVVGASFELSWCAGAFSLRMWREVGPECSPERQNAPGTAHTSSERVPAWPSEAPCALGLPRNAVTLRNRSGPTLANPGCGHAQQPGGPTLAGHRPPAIGHRPSPIAHRPSPIAHRPPAIGPTQPPPAVPGALGRRTCVGFIRGSGPRRVTEHGHEVERPSIPPGWVVNMAMGVASRG
jgi:hypothetical protein